MPRVNKVTVQVVETKQKPGTKQSEVTNKYYVPKIEFDAMILAIEENFCLGGVVEKIGSSGRSYRENLNDDVTEYNEKEQEVWDFINTLDVELILQSLFTAGNAFVEVITGADKKRRCDFMLPGITRVCKPRGDDESNEKPYSYLQLGSSTEPTYFDYDEVLHFKTGSLSSKIYGQSKVYKCLEQVLLLNSIDKYYRKVFDKSRMGLKIINDKQGKLNDKQKDLIADMLAGSVGIDNAFAGLILSGADLQVVDLEDGNITDAFLSYRDRLIQAVAVATNIPYDMLVSIDSNRATSDSAIRMFYENVVSPLQDRFVDQLRVFLEYFGYDKDVVSKVALHKMNTEDWKLQMEILTGYKRSGVITSNEARQLSPFELTDREDGDGLKMTGDGSMNSDQKAQDILKIEKSVEKMYSHLSNKKNV